MEQDTLAAYCCLLYLSMNTFITHSHSMYYKTSGFKIPCYGIVKSLFFSLLLIVIL